DYLETENSFKRDKKLKLLSLEVAKSGQWEILEELLEKGARLNPSLFENKEESLLMYAAQYQQEEIVYKLLQRGAKVYLRGSQKEELFKSYKRANEYQKMTELVLSYGSLLKKKKEKKEWALMHQLVSGSIGEKEIFKFLNQYPLLSMEAQNEEGQGILEEAIENNDQNLASRALSFGVSLNGKTKEGKTFLEEALYKDRVWFFKLFNEEELKIEAQKVFKNGILNEAILNGAIKIRQYLIDNHIGLEDKDKKSRTPLMNAYFYEITSLLHPLLAKTKEINQEDKDGRTALFYPVLAAQYGWLMQLFRVKGKEIQIDHQDKFGETALMKAVLMNNKEIVQQLIAEGADILIKNDEGKDVFNLAMSEGNIKMANLIKREMKKKLGIVSAPKKMLLPKKRVTNWAFNAQNTNI
ncbi:MAG: ankyrin repeat domain-containing protein, partial [Alphaproteobacteria bacterium]|nr:ankyrin repeat domain-containing protein [Alphaproteobacteria bacterium]